MQTLNLAGEPHPFNGDLKVRVRPGRLQQDAWVTFENGTWTGTVEFEAAFGPHPVLVQRRGDKQSSSDREPSYGTGVSDPIHIQFPTIVQMQEIDDHETNQLAGEFAELRISDREVVVTRLGTNGFGSRIYSMGPPHTEAYTFTASRSLLA